MSTIRADCPEHGKVEFLDVNINAHYDLTGRFRPSYEFDCPAGNHNVRKFTVPHIVEMLRKAGAVVVQYDSTKGSVISSDDLVSQIEIARSLGTLQELEATEFEDQNTLDIDRAIEEELYTGK